MNDVGINTGAEKSHGSARLKAACQYLMGVDASEMKYRSSRAA